MNAKHASQLQYKALPLGGGGGSSPSLIFSCFSFSISRRRWVRIFFLSFFVNMMGKAGASLGSAKKGVKI